MLMDCLDLVNGSDIISKVMVSYIKNIKKRPISEENITSGRILDEFLEILDHYNYTLTPGESAFVNCMLKLHDVPRDGPAAVVILTVIYSVIFVTGLIGNICTCLVIIRNKYMGTVTNYYLLNLSISDLLLLLLGLPHEVYSVWSPAPYVLGEAFCRFRVLASETSTNVSVLTITSFTVERYIAICHPISRPRTSGFSRPLRVMAVVWFLSCACAVPVGLQFGITHSQVMLGVPISDTAQCGTRRPEEAKVVFQVSTFLFFVFPMIVITLLYCLIAMAIRRSLLARTGSDHTTDSSLLTSDTRTSCVSESSGHRTFSARQFRLRRSVLKMLVSVVVAFFLCWAPFHGQRLMAATVTSWTEPLLFVHNLLFYCSGVAYYLSATINPVLYSIMSLKFRQAFQATLLCCCCCLTRLRPPCHRPRTAYTFRSAPRCSRYNMHCPVEGSSSSSSKISNRINQLENIKLTNTNGIKLNSSNPLEIVRLPSEERWRSHCEIGRIAQAERSSGSQIV